VSVDTLRRMGVTVQNIQKVVIKDGSCLSECAPAAACSIAGASVDLVAVNAFDGQPPVGAEAQFPAAVIQIPASFRATAGAPGTGLARFEYGLAGSRSSCDYRGDGNRTYRWASCSTSARPGDLLKADFVRLTLLEGDPAAGPLEVRAQLPLDPLG